MTQFGSRHTDDPKDARPARVLCVDDNRDAATLLAMFLNLRGAETHIAHDGPEAVQAADAFKPDLVLLDLGLPTLDGFEVAREIRRQPWGKDMVLVALTASDRDEDKQRSHEAGFNHYLIKSLEHETLEELLANMPARS